MEKSCLLLGSNQGDRQSLLQQATDLIRQRVGSVACCSPLYETAPWGQFEEGEDQPFLNMAMAVDTAMDPQSLLSALKDIERDLGREIQHSPPRLRYSSRPIDIDIILYGSLVLDSPELTIPHPRMRLRRFVLQPLCDIAPDAVHPLLKKTVHQLLEECPDTSSLSCCA